MADNMFDLIYCENDKDETEITALIRKEFPQAIIADANDNIHSNRFSVSMDRSFEDKFLVFAIVQGFGMCSFTINLMTMDKEKQPHLKELIAEADKINPPVARHKN